MFRTDKKALDASIAPINLGDIVRLAIADKIVQGMVDEIRREENERTPSDARFIVGGQKISVRGLLTMGYNLTVTKGEHEQPTEEGVYYTVRDGYPILAFLWTAPGETEPTWQVATARGGSYPVGQLPYDCLPIEKIRNI